MVPGHVLVWSDFAVPGLPLVDDPAEELVCGVIVAAIMTFDTDPHLVNVWLHQGSKTSCLEVGPALFVALAELPQGEVELAVGELGGTPQCRTGG